MRLIDADALIQAVEENPLVTDSVKEYVQSVVKNAPAIETQEDLRLLSEELKHHVDYLTKENKGLEGQTKALAFAVRCNGVSGNEVSYEVN